MHDDLQKKYFFIGVLGAFFIRNFHQNEFYLKLIIPGGIPVQDRVYFVCNLRFIPQRRINDSIF